ncbi:MAG: hypothetical protein PHF67_01055 [Candidatus Nanoarchaeia archaeon]|nr:hypothetical protein [Candidatus Nanoarchaeia archaeon]
MKRVNKKIIKKEVKKKKIGKWLYWSPRILSILFLLFLALFSLDIFDGCNDFFTCLLGLFMHNIPVLILAVLLWISWKRELIGAIVFALAGLLYIAQLLFNSAMDGFQWYYLVWSLQIAGPAFVVAFLWYLNWKRK